MSTASPSSDRTTRAAPGPGDAARFDAGVLEARRRQRGWGFAICAAVAFGAFLLDWVVAGRPVPEALALRALWALQFLICGWLLTRASPRLERQVYLLSLIHI